ncbi:MAG: glycoside hydrolase family 43 protein [Deltaproteobacteria bacterium]|nr:glycoside hydrolase family 43 protein [Deltaproteobacteria bacterium]MBN2670086.1 glycoside hydrolase family 43 protein [Deltaproteobacteria bacterium]
MLPGKPGYGRPPKKPLIDGIYTADPSAHVFDGKLYIYPSHDQDDDGTHAGDADAYNMVDYHVFSMEQATGPVTDHGVALRVSDIPWVSRQLWAPDAAYKNDTYFLYFPARDRRGIFRIGVAVSDSPTGPFIADPAPIEGSFSIDPAVFVDDDDQAYMYFGGLWGGELERWTTGSYNPQGTEPAAGTPAIGPRVARLSANMRSFDGPVKEAQIITADGTPVKAGSAMRFFEGAWVHKKGTTYYLSYSTGDNHTIVYATSNSPWGPFIYRGVILSPVIGWTTHHSIVEFKGKWYLFYHDASLSGGVDHQRCVKVAELEYRQDGSIKPIKPE